MIRNRLALLLLCINTLHGSELPKELTSTRDKVLLNFSTLPIEVQGEILHHCFHDDYIPSVACYALLKNRATQRANKKELWHTLVRGNNNHAHYCRSLINSLIKFKNLDLVPLDDENISPVLGPNKNGLLYCADQQKFFHLLPLQPTVLKLVTYVKQPTCLHPFKNKFLRTQLDESESDESTIIKQYLCDPENGTVTKDYTAIIPGYALCHVQYDQYGQDSENLLGIRDLRTIVKVTIQKNNPPLLTEIASIGDLVTQKLCKDIAKQQKISVEQIWPHTIISGLQICKKYPRLILATVRFNQKDEHSFLCDTLSQPACIKQFDHRVGFCQPLDTLANNSLLSTASGNKHNQLAEELLTLTPAKKFINQNIEMLTTQVIPTIDNNLRAKAQLFNKQKDIHYE